MSPELSEAWKKKKPTILADPYRSDMFSIGIILLQLCYRDIRVNSMSMTN